MSKFKTLAEAFDFEDIPVDGNVENDTQPQELEDTSTDVVASAYSTVIKDLTKKVFDVIAQASSIIATADSDTNCPDKENFKTLLNLVVDEGTIMVGIINKAETLINPETGKLLDAGEIKAEDALNNEE